MQDTGRKYVRYINKTYQRTGALWQGRYKAGLIDSEAYLLKLYALYRNEPGPSRNGPSPGRLSLVELSF